MNVTIKRVATVVIELSERDAANLCILLGQTQGHTFDELYVHLDKVDTSHATIRVPHEIGIEEDR